MVSNELVRYETELVRQHHSGNSELVSDMRSSWYAGTRHSVSNELVESTGLAIDLVSNELVP